MTHESVCVIGAGLSGLTTTKCMIDAGFDVTCFDANDHIGGRWNIKNKNPIPASTILNVSKGQMCFSDFPIPEQYPLYLSAAKFTEFLYLYMENFSLMEHVKLSCPVMKVQTVQGEVGDKTRWAVTYKLKDHVQNDLFDYCVVCSGFNSKAFVPNDVKEVLKGFNGKVIHSIDYKGWREFEDKNVLICGFGNTGGDLACELSSYAKSVYISTRHGASIIPRILENQTPVIEKLLFRNPVELPKRLKKEALIKFLNEVTHRVYNQDTLGLSAKSFDNVCINDDICMKIICGKVVVQPGISSCSGNTFTFTNGTRVEDIDAVVLCTCYARDFSFLEDGLISLEKNDKFVSLYKNIFPINGKDSIGFVGIVTNKGSLSLLAEIQARYVAEVFLGKIKLPKGEDMSRAVKLQVKSCTEMFGEERNEYNIDYGWSTFIDLAEEIGCNISIGKLLFTDPKLAWCLLTKYNSHELRLVGPNCWDGARDAILSEQDRVYGFLKHSRQVKK